MSAFDFESLIAIVGSKPLSMWDDDHPLHPLNEEAFDALMAAAQAARVAIKKGGFDPAIALRVWNVVVLQPAGPPAPRSDA